jgi:hypothetical protein
MQMLVSGRYRNDQNKTVSTQLTNDGRGGGECVGGWHESVDVRQKKCTILIMCLYIEPSSPEVQKWPNSNVSLTLSDKQLYIHCQYFVSNLKICFAKDARLKTKPALRWQHASLWDLRFGYTWRMSFGTCSGRSSSGSRAGPCYCSRRGSSRSCTVGAETR